MNRWALEELIGHFVNYRNQVSPHSGQRLACGQFQLYAVSTRWPEKLIKQGLGLQPVQTGVYDCDWALQQLRVLVLNQIPQREHNALWHLFSAAQAQVRYGAEHYQLQNRNMSTVLQQLFDQYQLEGVLAMPYTMKDFERDYTREHLHTLTPEERLQGLDAEERLRGLDAKERLRGLDAKERLRGLDAKERLQGLDVEEILQGLSVQERQKLKAYLARLELQNKDDTSKH